MKPFRLIPGPKTLNPQDFTRLYEAGLAKYKAFGPVVKSIEIDPPILWIFDPQDMKTLCNIKDKYPGRESHKALEKYRMDRPDLYSSGGLLPTNGKEWRRLRMPAQKPMMGDNFTKLFINEIDTASLEFVEYLKSKPVWDDILQELKKHFLEITTRIILGISLKALEMESLFNLL